MVAPGIGQQRDGGAGEQRGGDRIGEWGEREDQQERRKRIQEHLVTWIGAAEADGRIGVGVLAGQQPPRARKRMWSYTYPSATIVPV